MAIITAILKVLEYNQLGPDNIAQPVLSVELELDGVATAWVHGVNPDPVVVDDAGLIEFIQSTYAPEYLDSLKKSLYSQMGTTLRWDLVSIDRTDLLTAIGMVVMDEINILRQNAGLAPRTWTQFKSTIKAKL